MLETIILGTFILGLLLCIGFGKSILYALSFGYLLFFAYGLIKKHKAKDVFFMSLEGIKTIKNILIVYVLIGILTAVWRASGTIPFIIFYATKLIVPQAFILITFLLCCIVSVLTGTAFGTVATLGVICMTMGNAMGANQILVGGAIFSGIYFGDRCSPMSTSALMTAELTGTDIYKNIKLMVKTSLVPFIITCAAYLTLGFIFNGNSVTAGSMELFPQNFDLHWLTVLPAVVIIVLSLFKVKVKYTMIVSIVFGSIICLTLQNVDIMTLLKTYIFGFTTKSEELSAMLKGGGILSMVNVSAIVTLSSSYAGLFEGTGLLNGLKKHIKGLAEKVTTFGTIALTSIFTAMVSCNQTLTIILTNQLCKDLTDDNYEMSIALENTAVIMPPLIPWTISAAVPLATISAPLACIPLAFYLYLIPVYNFFTQKHTDKVSTTNKTANEEIKLSVDHTPL